MREFFLRIFVVIAYITVICGGIAVAGFAIGASWRIFSLGWRVGMGL